CRFADATICRFPLDNQVQIILDSLTRAILGSRNMALRKRLGRARRIDHEIENSGTSLPRGTPVRYGRPERGNKTKPEDRDRRRISAVQLRGLVRRRWGIRD